MSRNQESLEAFAECRGIVRRATLPWNILPRKAPAKKGAQKKLDRCDIANHLYDQAMINEGVGEFSPLREALNECDVSAERFVGIITRKSLRSRHPLMAAASIYIALYYTDVGGVFNIKEFAQNYHEAKRF